MDADEARLEVEARWARAHLGLLHTPIVGVAQDEVFGAPPPLQRSLLLDPRSSA
jgi:hypothetical protein